MPTTLDWPHTTPMTPSQLKDLIELVASVIEHSMDKAEEALLFSELANGVYSNVSSFHRNSIPAISIKEYIARHIDMLELDETHLIAAIIFLERYLRSPRHYPLTGFNCHALLGAIFTLVHKFNDDIPFKFSEYAIVASVTVSELKKLEVELLIDLNADLYISAHTYLETKHILFQNSQMPLYQRANKKPYSFSISEEELVMLRELTIEPLYHAPESAHVNIDLDDLKEPTPLLIPQPIRLINLVPNLALDESTTQNCKRLIFPRSKNPSPEYCPRFLMSRSPVLKTAEARFTVLSPLSIGKEHPSSQSSGEKPKTISTSNIDNNSSKPTGVFKLRKSRAYDVLPRPSSSRPPKWEAVEANLPEVQSLSKSNFKKSDTMPVIKLGFLSSKFPITSPREDPKSLGAPPMST